MVSEVFWPEETSTGYFMTGIAEHLSDAFEVSVICGQPKYDRRGERPPSRERHRGVEIHRAAATTLDKNVVAFRIVNVASIAFGLLWTALRQFRAGDVVLVTTNPPVAPFLIMLASRIRGARYALIVHDVYPDNLVAAGIVTPQSLAVRLLNRMNRYVYRGAARIVVLGRDMATLVATKAGFRDGMPPVEVIPNWGDIDVVKPEGRDQNAMLERLGLTERFVVQYAGNAGPTHDVESIIEAARALRLSEPDVHFLFLGSGSKWKWLTNVVERESLVNVSLLGPQPRGQQQAFLNACDISISAFVRGMAGVGVPSRMYNVMAAGRPMIAAVDDTSEQARVIHEEQIGWVVKPGDAAGLTAALRAASASRATLGAMGARARQVAEQKYSRARILSMYGAMTRSILGRQ